MGTENFNTWIETDPNNRLTQTADRSTYTALERGDGDTHLVKDFGVGHFDLAWTILWKMEITALEAGDASSRLWIYPICLANNASDALTNPRITLEIEQFGASEFFYKMRLRVFDDVGNTVSDLTAVPFPPNTVFYCTMERNNGGDDVTITFRTVSHTGVVFDTITVSIATFSDDVLRYVFCPFWETAVADPNDWITGYLEELDVGDPRIPCFEIVINSGCGEGTTPSLGETFRLIADISDLDGTPITAGLAHLITIQDPNGVTILTSVAPTNAGGGNYFVNFLIPLAGDVGGYRAFWTATVGGNMGIAKFPFWVDDP